MSTAHRLVSELSSWRLLERTTDGHYRAGLRLRTIGGTGPTGSTLPELAPCVLEDLAAVTKRRVRLGVLHDMGIYYIVKHPGPEPVSTCSPAARLPAHATALGRALLAFSPPATAETLIRQGLRPYTPRTITSPERFRRALAVTRLTRCALTRDEFEPGLNGVAMPVFGPGGQVVAAIEITGDDIQDELPTIIKALTIATRSLSRDLSGSPTPNEPAPPIS